MTLPRSLIAILLTIGIVSTVQATLIPAPQRFMDVPAGAWYASYVEDAADLGIVSGYRDRYGRETGLFGPEKQVTVAEALKIVLEGAGYDKNRGIGYGHWAVQYLSIARGIGFAVTLDPRLNLDRPASRAEVASIVVDAFHIPETMTDGSSFQDVSPAHPYKEDIDILRSSSVISGDTDENGVLRNYFRPDAAINRAETVKIALGARSVYGTPGSELPFVPSSGSSAGGCMPPVCRIPPPGCTYVDVPFDARGCQVTCGTLFCTGSSSSASIPSWCVPPVCPIPLGGSCRYVNPLYDSSGCQATCGTLQCGGSTPCRVEECGLAPGIPNRWCPDGSMSGPVCERRGSPYCGWNIRQCPAVSSSSQSSVAATGCLSDSECVSRGQGSYCRHYDDQGQLICNSYCSTTNGQVMCAAVCAGVCSSTPDPQR